ncbi:MAG: gamma-glutamyltransferase, partial [Bacteroidia bacterium]|nr:gamma-glutamyltransferase [Bacteroidia bacterium]
GGFLIYYGKDSTATAIDFREKAPLAATSTMYQDEDGQLVRGSNHRGLKAAGVPGTVAGLYLAHQNYGRLPWPILVQPAIDLARDGFPLPWSLYFYALRVAEYEEAPEFMNNYFRDSTGQIIMPGDTWTQPALAHTLSLIRDHGHDGFYKGAVAEEIEAYMAANGGIITREDLLKYRAIERQPIHGSYEDYEIYSMPPPSSGGVILVEMMNLMEQANLDSIEFNSTAYVHLVAEVMRRGFADRAQYLGDPDFNPDMPLDRLTSKDYAKKRFAHIDMHTASISDSSQFGHPYDGDHTTHFSVIDPEGNAVSLTYTLEQGYGSKMGSPKLGFLFNNEMGDFNPVAGVTTSRGLIGSKPNLIQPEKRMLSSMTPTIVVKNGRPHLIIGSPGGRTIINTVFQTVLNVLAYDMRIDKAIEAMKIHHQWLPDRISYERHLMSPDTRDALMSMGHTLRAVGNLGVLMGITYDEELKAYIGASDSASANGGAVGF